MPPKMQRIRDKKSQHMPCVVIVSNVSDIGNALFDMIDVATGVLGRTSVRRRSIGLIALLPVVDGDLST